MPRVVRLGHISRVPQEEREMAALGVERNKLCSRVMIIAGDTSPYHSLRQKMAQSWAIGSYHFVAKYLSKNSGFNAFLLVPSKITFLIGTLPINFASTSPS